MSQWKVTVTATAEKSFTSFIEEVAKPLRQALIAAYGPDVGPDVTAEALAYGWEHWDRISSMRNPAGYLYRVGQSRAKRGIFRRPPRLDSIRHASDGYRHFEPALTEAISRLSERQRAAVILVHGYEWSITEVAELWGVGFSTVSAHLDRAMKRLRSRLGVEA